MRRSRDTAPAGLVTLAVLTAAGAPLQAAEWSIAPTLSLWVDRDTNRNLVPDGTPSEGSAMSLDVPLQYATERLTLALHPEAVLQRFSDRVLPNSNDFRLGANVNWQDELSIFTLSNLSSDQSLLTSELSTTGIVIPGTRRREEATSLSWTYAQSERRSLTLGASYDDVRYRGGAQNTLQDYHDTQFSASQAFKYSDRLTALLTASASNYRPQDTILSARTDSAVVGFKLQLSERNRLSADAGLNRTTFLSQTSSGFQGDLTLTRETLLGSFNLTAMRNVAPLGFGEVTQQDSLSIGVQRQLSSRLSFDSTLGVSRYSSVFHFQSFVFDLSYLDRTFTQFSLGLGWRTSETWSLALHGIAHRVEGKTVPNADGWQIRLESVWTPLGRRVSR